MCSKLPRRSTQPTSANTAPPTLTRLITKRVVAKTAVPADQHLPVRVEFMAERHSDRSEGEQQRDRSVRAQSVHDELGNTLPGFMMPFGSKACLMTRINPSSTGDA